MNCMEFEDSTYSSTSEAELDSDHEDFEFDSQKLLGTWLGELESLKLGLESPGSGMQETFLSPPSADKHLHLPRLDSYRFSMATLEDSQDGELDAILGELCALENQFDREIFSGATAKCHQRSISSASQSSGVSSLDPRQSLSQQSHSVPSNITSNGGLTPSHPTQRFSTHSRSSSGGTKVKFDITGLNGTELLDGAVDDSGRLLLKQGEMGPRTDSPDNDSAFSDTVSMLSSESSASSGGGPTRSELSYKQNGSSKNSNASLASSPTQTNLFIKAYTADGSAKSLLIDEKMSVGYVTKLLVDKNHVMLDHRWSIVEHNLELYMERIFEDHENLVENLLLWTRDSKNKLLFLERDHKYDLFLHPEAYFLMGSAANKDVQFDDDSRSALIDEIFSGKGVCIPEVEGSLYLKSDGKKAWKKHYFVLRASGLYYCPKGKSKLPKDLVCLVTFETNHIYLGAGWKKKYKAPTDFGFAVKHPQIQTKASKYIKYLCAEDERSLHLWVTGIRIAKHGRQLLDNYRMLLQDLAEEDLEVLAHARSFSISSMVRSGTSSYCTTPSSPVGPTFGSVIPSSVSSSSISDAAGTILTPVSTLERSWGRRSMARQDSVRSSSSSGTMLSERSGNGTPTGGEPYGFDSDSFPMGTIKRKPSVTPKIPLTTTTRILAKQSLGDDEEGTLELECTPTSTLSRTGTLRRTLRRSLTEEKLVIAELAMGAALRRQAQECNERPMTPPPIEEAKTETEVDSLPLPPPPEFATSMESLLSVESLPPPPPEAYNSNLGLESPPLPPAKMPLSDRRNEESTMLGTGVPSHLLEEPRSQLMEESRVQQVPCSSKSDGTVSVAPVPPPKPGHRIEGDAAFIPPPFLAELKAQGTSPKSTTRWRPGGTTTPTSQPTIANGHGAEQHDKSHPVEQRDKGHVAEQRDKSHATEQRAKSPPPLRHITFRDEVGGGAGQKFPLPSTGRWAPPPPPPPPLDLLVRVRSNSISLKPAPPRRSESTRLSMRATSTSGAHAPSHSPVSPPRAFLADLQRVMEKKWKVAQQLKVDLNSTPHAVMGFRDPPLPSDVLCCTTHIDEKHRVAAAKAAALASVAAAAAVPSPQSPPSPVAMVGGFRGTVGAGDDNRASLTKKKFPPPPPKRSDSTQLTTRAQ